MVEQDPPPFFAFSYRTLSYFFYWNFNLRMLKVIKNIEKLYLEKMSGCEYVGFTNKTSI